MTLASALALATITGGVVASNMITDLQKGWLGVTIKYDGTNYVTAIRYDLFEPAVTATTPSREDVFTFISEELGIAKDANAWLVEIESDTNASKK